RRCDKCFRSVRSFRWGREFALFCRRHMSQGLGLSIRSVYMDFQVRIPFEGLGLFPARSTASRENTIVGLWTPPRGTVPFPHENGFAMFVRRRSWPYLPFRMRTAIPRFSVAVSGRRSAD